MANYRDTFEEAAPESSAFEEKTSYSLYQIKFVEQA